MNSLKTAVLMAALAGILIVLGNYFWGMPGIIFAGGLALVINLVSYFNSDKIVLAMYRAKEVPPGENPDLHAMVAEVAAHAGLPKPRVFVVPSAVPNAFATGRNPAHSVVAVTEGILKLLKREELKGVIAHEMSHIKNRDILISTIAATAATAITMLANMLSMAALFGGGGRNRRGGGGLEMLALAILAPVAAALVQMAISRSREYAADQSAAGLTGNPLGLADALTKLARGNQIAGGMASPTTAHMFTVSSVRGGSFASLFSTHPPFEERVRRLHKMAGLAA
jgi:heat shock protein HtpX